MSTQGGIGAFGDVQCSILTKTRKIKFSKKTENILLLCRYFGWSPGLVKEQGLFSRIQIFQNTLMSLINFFLQILKNFEESCESSRI